MKNGFFCLSDNKVNKWGEIGDWINIHFQSFSFFFFASILFIFKRKICLKTEFIKKHIKVFCVEKDKKEKTFFICEFRFLRQSLCWNHLIHDLNCNYPVIFSAFSLLSCLSFPEALPGQLPPCCCLQGHPALPICNFWASWGSWWSTCSSQSKSASSPCPSSLVLQWALRASSVPSGLILP